MIYLLLTSSKGISSVKMAKRVGVSQKTAWKMMHAVREMMDLRDEIGPALKKVVEIDEKHLGGKPRKQKGVKHPRGKGTKKTPVLVMVQRNGSVRLAPIANDSFETMAPHIRRHICPTSSLMTDQHACYQKIASEFARHLFVNHSKDEFARTDGDGNSVHNNTAESVNSILEGSYKSVYHWWSKGHFHRYLNEIAFRWNHRKPVRRRKRGPDGEVRERVVMVELPFMELFRSLLSRAAWRQTRRTPSNGLRVISRTTYHWPSGVHRPV